MSFTEVFGGATIYPAGQSYLSLTFAVDQQLAWPIEQSVGGNIVSSIMDLDATAPGLNVDIPSAQQVSNGIQSVFNNVGANTITIRDAAGGTILSIVPGSAWVAYLTDNSTLAGTWRVFQLGASVSVAVASALAGAGLKAIGTTLNQRIAPTSTAVTPIVWVDGDRAQLTVWTGGLGVLDLPAPGVVGSDWFAMIRNSGSGDLTITPPAGTIDGGVTLTLSPGSSATVVTDGVNFFTVGLGQSTASFFDFLEINVAGSGDYVLSGVELNRISYRFIGALTGSRNIIVPSSVQQYWVDNSTSGAFSLFVKTVPQAVPVEVLQTARNILYCDGADVVPAESSTISFPVSIVQGGTGAITAPLALAALGGVPLTRVISTVALSGLAGGGDLTANRALALDSNNLTVENVLDSAVDTIPFYDDSAGVMRKTALANIQGSPNVLLRRQTSDQSVVASTVLVNNSVLQWVIAASGNYILDGLFLLTAANVTPDIRLQFSSSAFDTLLAQSRIMYMYDDVGTASILDQTPDAFQILSVPASTMPVRVSGMIRVTGATTIAVQFAQNVSDAGAITMEEGSWCRLIRTGAGGSTSDDFIS